jgi:hypothetical protein
MSPYLAEDLSYDSIWRVEVGGKKSEGKGVCEFGFVELSMASMGMKMVEVALWAF